MSRISPLPGTKYSEVPGWTDTVIPRWGEGKIHETLPMDHYDNRFRRIDIPVRL
jgi:hypothetical protein